MKTTYPVVFVLILLLASLLGCTKPGPAPQPTTPGPPPISVPSPDEGEIKTDPSGVKFIVDPDKIVGGGPPKDGIPSIDHPQFVPLDEADQWIEDNELVLGITYQGVKRVYPLQIMVWHEIVNDFIAGDPLLITY
jgi:hypothetical protein